MEHSISLNQYNSDIIYKINDIAYHGGGGGGGGGNWHPQQNLIYNMLNIYVKVHVSMLPSLASKTYFES